VNEKHSTIDPDGSWSREGRKCMSDLRLIEAVKTGDISLVEELLEMSVDVNQQDEQGWTALNWAAGKGDVEITKHLLRNGADVFNVGRDQRTPYKIALAAGRVDVVKLLKEAELASGTGRSSATDRKYCKAYPLAKLRQFSGWVESRINWKAKNNGETAESEAEEFSDDDIMFIHQDYTVTQSMWHNENVIFNQVTSEWKDFCTTALNFKVPDDLDLIVQANSQGG
jgi:ankyrin repeat protein